MPLSCPATPAGLGSSRSRWRAAGCPQSTQLIARSGALAEAHRRWRSERPLRTSRTLTRETYSCLLSAATAA